MMLRRSDDAIMLRRSEDSTLRSRFVSRASLQATVGPQPPDARRPRAYDPAGQFKHDAWATLGAITPQEARARYVDVLALVILVGAALEKRAGGDGYYAAALAAPTPAPFLRRVLAPTPGA